MDYRGFCETGRETWQDFEDLLDCVKRQGLGCLDHAELEKFAGLHRRIVSDFAYARTHFAGTDTLRRLRALAFDGHRLLGRKHQPILGTLREFYLRGYRRAFREGLPALTVSLSLFVGGAALGFVITLINSDFGSLFFGAGAVEGIRRGEIWTDSVGHIAPPAVLSGVIFTNNMSVALLCWLGGALFGLLTTYMIIFNGMMLGTVVSLTWQYHLSSNLLAFIAAHGPLELFLIVVAGAAGLELARGQLSPQNLPRALSFRRGARRSLQIVAGTLPWLILLGIVEGFVSPEMGIQTWVKALLGAVLLAAFLAYALAPPAPHGQPETETELAAGGSP